MIHNGWGETKCGKENMNEYRKLINKYSVRVCFDAQKFANSDEYDILIKPDGMVRSHIDYRVVKNKPNLKPIELALICDGGNLCFGFMNYGNNLIRVYID